MSSAGQIIGKFPDLLPAPQRKNALDFSDLVMFHLAPPPGQTSHVQLLVRLSDCRAPFGQMVEKEILRTLYSPDVTVTVCV